MSRTFRHIRPRFLNRSIDWLRVNHYLVKGQSDQGRDGVPQRHDPSCGNHKGCPWCTGNRLFSSEKRKPLEEN